MVIFILPRTAHGNIRCPTDSAHKVKQCDSVEVFPQFYPLVAIAAFCSETDICVSTIFGYFCLYKSNIRKIRNIVCLYTQKKVKKLIKSMFNQAITAKKEAYS